MHDVCRPLSPGPFRVLSHPLVSDAFVALLPLPYLLLTPVHSCAWLRELLARRLARPIGLSARPCSGFTVEPSTIPHTVHWIPSPPLGLRPSGFATAASFSSPPPFEDCVHCALVTPDSLNAFAAVATQRVACLVDRFCLCRSELAPVSCRQRRFCRYSAIACLLHRAPPPRLSRNIFGSRKFEWRHFMVTHSTWRNAI